MGLVGRYALVKDGTVENVIVADESFDMPGYELLRLTDDECVSPGDTWNGERFIAAPKPEPVPEPRDELEQLTQVVADLAEVVLLGGVKR